MRRRREGFELLLNSVSGLLLIWWFVTWPLDLFKRRREQAEPGRRNAGVASSSRPNDVNRTVMNRQGKPKPTGK